MEQIDLITEQEAERVYKLAHDLWFQFYGVTLAGHPGVYGPSSQGEPWSMSIGLLKGAALSLEEIKKLPDPIRTLKELVKAGNLKDFTPADREKWDAAMGDVELLIEHEHRRTDYPLGCQ